MQAQLFGIYRVHTYRNVSEASVSKSNLKKNIYRPLFYFMSLFAELFKGKT